MFFDHQRYFLHPSIASIWEEHQANYLKELHKEKRGLILGGDGRADSPARALCQVWILHNYGIEEESSP